MLVEMIQAADALRHELDWEGALARHHVAADLRDRVWGPVLDPASRHAPGIFAMAEIVALVPALAARAGIARGQWGQIARRAQRFGALLSQDGTQVQVMIRAYLRVADADAAALRALDPARMRLDRRTGITSVTPIADLRRAARALARAHHGDPHGVCVALQAMAPGGTTMFAALWNAYAAAADRLILAHLAVDPACIPPQEAPDPDFAPALAAIARRRREAPERVSDAAAGVARAVIGDLVSPRSAH